MHWLGYSVCPWSSQLRESETFPQAAVPALLWSTHPQHTVSSPKSQSLLIIWPNVFSVVTPLSDRTLKDSVTGFFGFVFIKKYFSAWRAWQSVLFFVFCHSGTRWGLSITPVSGQTAPSLELPQTHLQKIRHEIVWLLHHQGHLPPPTFRAPPFCCLLGLHVSWTALPSRLPLTFIRQFVIHGSKNWYPGTKHTDTTFEG